MESLRRLLSILLLAAFGLPFVSPLFALAATSETNLPVCCRRNGAHHCMMGAVGRAQTAASSPELRAPLACCPYAPASVVAAHGSDFGLAPTAAIYAAIVSHPASHPQTESKRRIARDRSRNKRGPPVLTLL